LNAAISSEPTIARHDQFMTLNYPRWPITMVQGRGCHLTDSTGKTYLDLFSGFGAGILGHCHPDLVDAAHRQINTLWHVGNLLHTEPQTLLAEQIASKGFGGRSYFCHSGSDANEAAFKLARLYGRGQRYKIIATLGSFHGRGFGAMMATGQNKVRMGYEPFLPGFEHVPYNDITALLRAIDDKTVAVIVEPIQGEGGVNMPDADYLQQLRRICDEQDLLLIFDEVWTGCGRTGTWFAHQHWGVVPDMMTLGKAVGCGLALGVMVAHPRVADLFSTATYGGVPHATTLGGNCIATAVAARMLQVIERDNLLSRAASLGEHITARLRDFARHGMIKQVRGKGLFIGIQLNPDGFWFDKAADVVNRCLDRGLLIGSAQQDILRLAPPMNVTDDEIDQGLSLLQDVLKG
jgi:predicted acetylornithine/succinylornithine family transaminase